MNTDMITKEVLTEAADLLKGSKDFVVEQAPDICQEIIYSGIAYHTIWFTISLIGIIVLYSMGNMLFNRSKQGDSYNTQDIFITSILFYAASALTSIGIWVNLYKLCYVWFCPKLYVLQTISMMLK